MNRFLARAKRDYAKAEKALIKAALVGCLNRDADPEESSSGRVVDLTQEIGAIRFARNELSMIEDAIRARRKKRR